MKTTLKFLGVELMPNGRWGVHEGIDNSCVLIVWNASLMSNPVWMSLSSASLMIGSLGEA